MLLQTYTHPPSCPSARKQNGGKRKRKKWKTWWSLGAHLLTWITANEKERATNNGLKQWGRAGRNTMQTTFFIHRQCLFASYFALTVYALPRAQRDVRTTFAATRVTKRPWKANVAPFSLYSSINIRSFVTDGRRLHACERRAYMTSWGGSVFCPTGRDFRCIFPVGGETRGSKHPAHLLTIKYLLISTP